jgi:hypothetical protein
MFLVFRGKGGPEWGCSRLTNMCSSAILALCLMHMWCINGLLGQVGNLGRTAVQVCGDGCPQQASGLAHLRW